MVMSWYCEFPSNEKRSKGRRACGDIESGASDEGGSGAEEGSNGAAGNSKLDEKVICFKEGCQATKFGRWILEERKEIR